MLQPGLWVATAVIGGTAFGVNTGVRAGDAAALTIAAASLIVLLRAARLRRVLTVVALASAMTAWGATARDRAAAPPLVTWFDQAAGTAGRLSVDSPVVVTGVLTDDATPAATGVALAIDVREVEVAGARRVVAGRLQAHVSGDLAVSRLRDWTRGRSVRAPVALRRPPMLLNFGAPSPARQLLRRPFALAGTIKSATLVEVERGAWGDEAAAALRWRVRAAAARFVAPRSQDAAAIVTAILIGDRAGLPDEVERRLQEAGTFHVIAISGGNVALLTAMCFGVLRLVIRSPRAVALATIAVVMAFGWVVGGEASVARAVAAAVLYLVLSIAGLRPAPVAALRAVAILLLVVDPLAVIDVGAWLSFAATLGIVTFGREWIAKLGPPGTSGKKKGLIVRAAFAVAVLVTASVAAELLLLPVAAATFARVSLAGLALNLIAIPAMALVQISGLLVAALATVWPAVAAAAAFVASAAATWLLDSCALIDVAPWLTWRVPPTDTGWTAAYYACLFAFTTIATGRARRVCQAAAAVCLAVIVWAPGVEAMQPNRARVRVTLLDVGQGEAVLLQTPDHRALLIDAGGTPGPFDIGGRVVAPALWAVGARRLDWLLVSHGDRDHVGGVPAVMRDLVPHEIWEGIPVPPDPDRRNLIALAHAFGISWRTVLAGDSLESGGVILDAMHPPRPEWERQKVRNDDSVVLRVRYGLVDFWLTGDAGGEFERTISVEDRNPRLTILKVGHHGSRTATSARLVDVLRPDIAIVSAGRGNLFGHPAREVVARLDGAGASVFRTDVDGAIVVETDGVTARVLTATGRSWSLTLSGVRGGQRH